MNRNFYGDVQANTGSTTRNHLANERTYLAWHRTGISVTAHGVAVAKFAPHRGAHAVASGLILIGAGLLVSAYGTVRYRAVGKELDAGVVTPTHRPGAFAGGVLEGGPRRPGRCRTGPGHRAPGSGGRAAGAAVLSYPAVFGGIR
jgi:putative membrane protein